MNLQISHGEYTLISANIFVGCLMVESGGIKNLLGVVTQHEILGFCI
jgi:hypothetical protein